MRSVQYRILSHRDRVIFRRKIDSRCFPQKIRQSSLLQHSTRCRYDRHHHQNHHVQTFLFLSFFFSIHPCNYYYLSLFNLVIHFFLFSLLCLFNFLSLSFSYLFLFFVNLKSKITIFKSIFFRTFRFIIIGIIIIFTTSTSI